MHCQSMMRTIMRAASSAAPSVQQAMLLFWHRECSGSLQSRDFMVCQPGMAHLDHFNEMNHICHAIPGVLARKSLVVVPGHIELQQQGAGSRLLDMAC